MIMSDEADTPGVSVITLMIIARYAARAGSASGGRA
jgi:hypothetical protein